MYTKVKAVNRDGYEFIIEGEGLMARALQHEIDHLDGKLFDSIVYEFVDAETVRKEQQTKRAKAKIK